MDVDVQYLGVCEPLYAVVNDQPTTMMHQLPITQELAKLPLTCVQLETPVEARFLAFNKQNNYPLRMTSLALLARLSYIIANRCNAEGESNANIVRHRLTEALTQIYDDFTLTHRDKRRWEIDTYNDQREHLIFSRLQLTQLVIKLFLDAVSQIYTSENTQSVIQFVHTPRFDQQDPYFATEQATFNAAIAIRADLLGNSISNAPMNLNTKHCLYGEPLGWADFCYNYMDKIYELLDNPIQAPRQ